MIAHTIGKEHHGNRFSNGHDETRFDQDTHASCLEKNRDGFKVVARKALECIKNKDEEYALRKHSVSKNTGNPVWELQLSIRILLK